MLNFELLHSGISIDVSSGLTQVVQKRLDYIRYSRRVPRADVGVEFLGWEEVDADDVLRLTDLSATFPENSPLVYTTNTETKAGKNITVDSLGVLISDRYSTTSDNKQVPLFYRHKLDITDGETATAVSMQHVSFDGKRSPVDPIHFVLDPDSSRTVFTDLYNSFDEDTGRYDLYYIQWVDEGGVSHSELLNTISAYHQATLDDLDPIAGVIDPTSGGYVVNQIGTQYLLNMPFPATWFVKYKNDAFIYLMPPALDTINDPWFIRIHNGSFSREIDNVVYNYSLTEFSLQDFSPIAPYMDAIMERAKKVNATTLKLQREKVLIRPDLGYHIDIVCFDNVTGDPKEAFTTNSLKHETKYLDTEIEWDSNVISAWDNETGLVQLEQSRFLDKHDIKATFYYEVDFYEYRLLNLNPFFNPSLIGKRVFFFMIPNLMEGETSVYYLLVEDGIIIATSNPDLAEFDENGNPNPNSVIGLPVYDDGTSGGISFESLYPSYLIMGSFDISCSIPLKRDMELDVRVNGGGVHDEYVNEAIRRNFRTSYMPGVSPGGGYEYPRYGSMLVKVPYILHKNYGGELSDQQIRDLVTKHMSAGEYPIIKLDGVIPEWGQDGARQGVRAIGEGCVELTWYSEDPSYTFNIYQASFIDGEYTLVASVSAGSGNNSLIICGLVLGQFYYFYLTAVSSDNIESPHSTIQGVRVY